MERLCKSLRKEDREAKLDRAIFQTLALNGPQIIFDIYKHVVKNSGLKRSRYATINKRVRLLEKSGYIDVAGLRMTKVGFQTQIHELATKTYLSIMLNSSNMDELMVNICDYDAQAILASIIDAYSKRA